MTTIVGQRETDIGEVVVLAECVVGNKGGGIGRIGHRADKEIAAGIAISNIELKPCGTDVVVDIRADNHRAAVITVVLSIKLKRIAGGAIAIRRRTTRVVVAIGTRPTVGHVVAAALTCGVDIVERKTAGYPQRRRGQFHMHRLPLAFKGHLLAGGHHAYLQ